MEKNRKELQGVVWYPPILTLEEKPTTQSVGEYIEYLPVMASRARQPKILPRIGKESVKVVVASGQVVGIAVIVTLEMAHSILLLIVELLRLLRRPSTYKHVKCEPAQREAAKRQEFQIEVNVKINAQ
jgi:hypothetical protein